MEDSQFDCAIVGGGPAGLSAALILGRCLRRVVVLDSGEYRNASAQELHGYLTRDCTPPAELVAIARDQLQRYPGVEYRRACVVEAQCEEDAFQLVTHEGDRIQSRKVLLATGLRDELPAVPGLAEMYGKSVFHCPYCDGWEHRGWPLAVYGNGESGGGLALTISHWSRDLVVCTDGPSTVPERDVELLARRGVRIESEKLRRLEGQDGQLERIVFEDGTALPRRAMFVHTRPVQRSDLAAQLGCGVDEKRSVETGKNESTSVPGVYVVGDASREVELAIVAAAEGAKAAFEINKALLREELAAIAVAASRAEP